MFEKKEMWFNILLLFVLHGQIHQSTAVNMCTNASTVSLSVTLNLIKGTDDNGCYCTVKLHYSDTPESVKSRIIFEVVKFSGCKYSLDVLYNNSSLKFMCSHTCPFEHTIYKTDEIKLYLEPATSYKNDTTFEVKITSTVTTVGGPFIRLECFQPNSTTNTTETTDTQQPTVGVISTTMDSTEKFGASKQSHKYLDISIIGGAVGGVVLLVIVVIIILVCMWRKKKTGRKNYDRPLNREMDHSYTNVDIVRQDQGNNSFQEDAATVNNGVHSNNNSLSPQLTDNTKQNVHVAEKMEIIQNDLYVSSDDIMDSISRDEDDTNQKPDTEYAVVKKDRKPTNTMFKDGGDSNSSIESNSDRRFVIGPQGDEYAIVNRK
ncbi:hypothetical protein LOTGIDRAFT_169912 [Lottia gigantea]|uniref:ZP domain-containing protein n=1 Tax=Lottia gigantea TaxID=225164 RepID=V3ZP12_LOTGI|nr:hypothetical protein LOTGIDRAFT_169912 [Lottia gigantea]ESO82591.1 hypothetical protein LOTGIDRAFT_169912 [Lottia gigantea]